MIFFSFLCVNDIIPAELLLVRPASSGNTLVSQCYPCPALKRDAAK
jgi:hypothetical protein